MIPDAPDGVSGFKQPKEDLNSSYAVSRHFTGEEIKSFPIFFKHYAPHHIIGSERTIFCTKRTELQCIRVRVSMTYTFPLHWGQVADA